MASYVYRYLVDGQVIYVGKTDYSLVGRINGHAKEEKFFPYLDDAVIEYAECANAADSAMWEMMLINKYQPVLNDALKYESLMTFPVVDDPHWKNYEDYLRKLQDKSSVRMPANDAKITIACMGSDVRKLKGYAGAHGLKISGMFHDWVTSLSEEAE